MHPEAIECKTTGRALVYTHTHTRDDPTGGKISEKRVINGKYGTTITTEQAHTHTRTDTRQMNGLCSGGKRERAQMVGKAGKG